MSKTTTDIPRFTVTAATLPKSKRGRSSKPLNPLFAEILDAARAESGNAILVQVPDMLPGDLYIGLNRAVAADLSKCDGKNRLYVKAAARGLRPTVKAHVSKSGVKVAAKVGDKHAGSIYILKSATPFAKKGSK
jgi:hypothetical protein